MIQWYVIRASGVVALALLSVSVVLGLLNRTRTASDRWPRFVIDRLQGRSVRHQAVPNFSTIAWKIRSGLKGVVQKRIPVASASAFPSAAATGL